MDPRTTSPAQKEYLARLNNWRRDQFARYDFRPGNRLPPGGGLQTFFRTQDEAIAAFHRDRLVAVGEGECLQCDGTGWVLYTVSGPTLAERRCDVCAGTGSWKEAWNRSTSTRTIYRDRLPGVAKPSAHSGGPNPPGQSNRPGPWPPPARESRPAGRRGVPGIVRVLTSYLIIPVVACLVAQPLSVLTDAPNLTVIIALIAGVTAAPVVNRVIFGPLREGQVLGPLWIVLGPVYGLAFLAGLTSGSGKSIDDQTVPLLVTAMELRHRFSRIPLGH